MRRPRRLLLAVLTALAVLAIAAPAALAQSDQQQIAERRQEISDRLQEIAQEQQQIAQEQQQIAERRQGISQQLSAQGADGTLSDTGGPPVLSAAGLLLVSLVAAGLGLFFVRRARTSS